MRGLLVGSDRRGDRGGDDGHTRAGADADPHGNGDLTEAEPARGEADDAAGQAQHGNDLAARAFKEAGEAGERGVECGCLLYTSPSPRDVEESRMPSSA